MSGFPLWSEANAEDMRGEEFLRARLAFCANKLAHYFGGDRTITTDDLSEGLGLAQEVQGYICTAMSLWYESLDRGCAAGEGQADDE